MNGQHNFETVLRRLESVMAGLEAIKKPEDTFTRGHIAGYITGIQHAISIIEDEQETLKADYGLDKEPQAVQAEKTA